MRGCAWLWLFLGGCIYVTEAEYESQLEQVDEDGDGVTVGDGDCDDTDPQVFPGRVEVPYDGIDNDCVGGDLADIDGDGFTAAQLGGPDCDDTDPDVAPDKPDAPYDGRDSDCARDNDFDLDGDGVMALVATPAAVAAYQAASGARFVPVYGDCDDDDPSIFPGSPEEVPYDGVDSDCAGDNDFDADGDGIERDSDCLDVADAALPGADPATVFPGADDVPYDGVDADCAGDNDFDADGDGFVRDEDVAAYLQYESTYGLDLGALPGDCDDDRSFVNPDGLERLGDLLDQNCDGAIDQATWAFGNFTLTGPEAPRLVTTPEGFVLAASVAQVGSPTLPTASNTVLTALFDRNPGPVDRPLDAQTVTNELPVPPGPAIDLAPTSAGAALVIATDDAIGLETSVGTLTTTGGVLSAFTPSSVSVAGLDDASAVHVREVDGDLRAITCAGERIALVAAGDVTTADLGEIAGTCFLDPEAVAVACGNEGCRSFGTLVDPPQLMGLGDDPEVIFDARQRISVRAEILGGQSGVRIVRPGQPDVTLLDADPLRHADI
ncbi:MAG: putative metal-binding motif-containing protein, partial [Myxococcota bacterium]